MMKCSHENLRSLELEVGRGWKLAVFGSFCLQVGLVPIANGIIIDNLASGQSIEQVRFRTCWPLAIQSIGQCWIAGAWVVAESLDDSKPSLISRGVEPDVHGAGYLGPPQRGRSGCQIL